MIYINTIRNSVRRSSKISHFDSHFLYIDQTHRFTLIETFQIYDHLDALLSLSKLTRTFRVLLQSCPADVQTINSIHDRFNSSDPCYIFMMYVRDFFLSISIFEFWKKNHLHWLFLRTIKTLSKNIYIYIYIDCSAISWDTTLSYFYRSLFCILLGHVENSQFYIRKSWSYHSSISILISSRDTFLSLWESWVNLFYIEVLPELIDLFDKELTMDDPNVKIITYFTLQTVIFVVIQWNRICKVTDVHQFALVQKVSVDRDISPMTYALCIEYFQRQKCTFSVKRYIHES